MARRCAKLGLRGRHRRAAAVCDCARTCGKSGDEIRGPLVSVRALRLAICTATNSSECRALLGRCGRNTSGTYRRPMWAAGGRVSPPRVVPAAFSRLPMRRAPLLLVFCALGPPALSSPKCAQTCECICRSRGGRSGARLQVALGIGKFGLRLAALAAFLARRSFGVPARGAQGTQVTRRPGGALVGLLLPTTHGLRNEMIRTAEKRNT